jgi:hypothetical protein
VSVADAIGRASQALYISAVAKGAVATGGLGKRVAVGEGGVDEGDVNGARVRGEEGMDNDAVVSVIEQQLVYGTRESNTLPAAVNAALNGKLRNSMSADSPGKLLMDALERTGWLTADQVADIAAASSKKELVDAMERPGWFTATPRFRLVMRKLFNDDTPASESEDPLADLAEERKQEATLAGFVARPKFRQAMGDLIGDHMSQVEAFDSEDDVPVARLAEVREKKRKKI